MYRFRRIFALLLTCLLLAGCDAQSDSTEDTDTLDSADTQTEQIEQTEQATEQPQTDPVIVSTLAVVGDIMVHSPQYNDAYQADTQTYDFAPMLRYAKNWLTKADFAVGNLETTFSGGDPSGYPYFNAPDSLATALADAGIDLVSTANNHTMDHGYDGLVRTLDTLDANGIAHVGTYRDDAEFAQNNGIYVADVGGIEVAMLSFTYGTNGIPVAEGKENTVNIYYSDYMSYQNTLDMDKIESDMAAARALDVDCIAVMVHWGQEYQLVQNEMQENFAAVLIEQGADIILGGHSHVLQPMELRTVTDDDGNEREVFICWSLGNFISSQNDEYTDTTAILQLELTKQDAQTTISNVTYVPMYMLDNEAEVNGERFILLDAHNGILENSMGKTDIVSDSTAEKLQKAIADAQMIIGQPWDLLG